MSRGLLLLPLVSLPFAAHPWYTLSPHPPPPSFISAVAVILRGVILLDIAIRASGQSFVVRFVVNCKSSMVQILVMALKALVLPEFFWNHMCVPKNRQAIRNPSLLQLTMLFQALLQKVNHALENIQDVCVGIRGITLLYHKDQ